MWNSFFDIKRDVLNLQRNFEGSSFQKNLLDIGFSCEMITEVRIDSSIRFKDKFLQGNILLEFSYSFEREAMYVKFQQNYFKKNEERDTAYKVIINHLVLWLESIDVECFIHLYNSDIIDEKLVRFGPRHFESIAVGESAKNLANLMNLFPIRMSQSEFFEYKINIPELFHRGYFVLGYEMKPKPLVRIAYCEERFSRIPNTIKGHTLFICEKKSDVLSFVSWLDEVRSDSMDAMLLIMEKIKEYGEDIIYDGYGHSFKVKDMGEFSVTPVFSDFSIKYRITTPSFEGKIVSSKISAIEISLLDYKAKRDILSICEKTDELVRKYGTFDIKTAGWYEGCVEATCFGEQFHYRFFHTMRGNEFVLCFDWKNDRKVYEFKTIEEMSHFALDKIQRYIYSVRVKSVFHSN